MTHAPLDPDRHHWHPEVWTKAEQHRYEDKTGSALEDIGDELRDMRGEVRMLSNRITLLLGGLGLVAFLLPIATLFVRALVP